MVNVPPKNARDSMDIHTPTSTYSSSSTRRDLDRLDRTKANKETTDIRFQETEKDIEETKKIALKARKIADEHPCKQEDRLKSMEGSVFSWDRWFKGVVVTVVVAVLGVATTLGALEYRKADREEVDAVRNDVLSIKKDVGSIQKSQERVEKALGEDAQAKREKQQMQLIKKALKEIVVETREE